MPSVSAWAISRLRLSTVLAQDAQTSSALTREALSLSLSFPPCHLKGRSLLIDGACTGTCFAAACRGKCRPGYLDAPFMRSCSHNSKRAVTLRAAWYVAILKGVALALSDRSLAAAASRALSLASASLCRAIGKPARAPRAIAARTCGADCSAGHTGYLTQRCIGDILQMLQASALETAICPRYCLSLQVPRHDNQSSACCGQCSHSGMYPGVILPFKMVACSM